MRNSPGLPGYQAARAAEDHGSEPASMRAVNDPTPAIGRSLAHTVLILDIWIFGAKPLQGIRVQDGGSREVLVHQSVKHRTMERALPSPPDGQPPVSNHIVLKRPQPGKVPPVQRDS